MLIRQHHSHEYQHRAEQEPQGDALAEHQPGKEDGGDGIEIDVVSSHDGPQFLQHPVPGQETTHGGHAAEEEEVEENGKIEELEN